jgi:hypothetical protein
MAIRISAVVNRILSVFVGFMLALIGGGITLFFVGSRWAAQEVAAQMADNSGEASHLMSQALGMISFLFTVAPVLTLAPAVVAVVVGELARIRSLLYYILAGGAAGALMPLIAAPYEAAQNTTYNAPYFSIMATAGFAAGLIYWLFAGRRA